MKKGALLLALLLAIQTLSAETQATGFLSFKYTHGQEFSIDPDGSFRPGPMGMQLSNADPTGLDFRVEIRVLDLNALRVEQAWLALGRSAAFSPKLGLYIVPFGIYNEINRPDQTLLINAPLSVEALFPERWRDIGIRVDGQTGPLDYALFVGNGLKDAPDLAAGLQMGDNNASKGAGGRIGLSLSQEWEAGYSLYRGKHDSANSLTTTLQTLHMSWITQGAVFLMEYTRSGVENPDDYAGGRADGYYILGSLDIGGIEPVISYQSLEYTDPYHGAGYTDGAGPGNGIERDGRRWSVGLVYRLSTRALLKFEYDFNREEGQDLDNDIATVELAVSWDPL